MRHRLNNFYLIILALMIGITGCNDATDTQDATKTDKSFAKTMGIADSLYNCMQFRDAYKLYLQLLDSKEAEADSEKRLNVLNALSNTSELSGHKVEQNKWLQQLIDLAKQTGNDYYRSLAHMTMGQNLFYEGNREKGIQNVIEAIDLMAKTDRENTDHLMHGHLRYCNAGHDVPMILANGHLTSLDAKPFLPVGLFEEVKYDMTETYMQPDSTLFLYTDGLTEAKNSERKQFGIKRVEEVLATCTDMHPQELLETIGKAVRGFVGDAEQSDDLTMLAIHYTPQQYESTLNETLTLTNDVREVAKLSSFQKSFYEKMNLETSLARQLRLAVEEAVVNVIEYAYPAGMEGSVEVTMMSDSHRLKVVIDDFGVPFDPTAEKKADITLSAEERRVGGLGIHLVRELMDSINYERVNGHNILTLRKQINK